MAGPAIEDFVSLWDLVEQRAALTPDHVIASDEDGARSPARSTATRRERVAAGLHAARRRARRERLVAPPHVARVVRARRRAGPARGGPEPDAADLPRPRGPVHHPADAARKLIITPSVWKGFDYEAMCREAAAELPGPRGARLRQVAARGRPGDAAAVRPGGRRGLGADPVDLLHVGHDRRPEGRAPHRPVGAAVGRRDGRRARHHRRRLCSDSCSRTRTSAGRPGRSRRSCRAASSCSSRRSCPRPRSRSCAAKTSRSPARARRSTWRTSTRSASYPTGEKLFPKVRAFLRRRVAEAAAAALRHRRRDGRRRHRARATGSPSSRSRPWPTSPTPTSSWPTPRAGRARASRSRS